MDRTSGRGGRIVRAWVSMALASLVGESVAGAATYTWTGGGGVNVNWSEPSNWGGAGPANNETAVGLVFPALNGAYASHNNLTGLHVDSLNITTQLSDGDYTFSGNAIELSGTAMMASPGSGNPNLQWQIPVVLGGDLTITTSGRQTQFHGPINLGTGTLTLDTEGDAVLAGVVSGSGNLVKNNTSALTITGINTYTGTTTGNRGAFYIGNAAALGGNGTGSTFTGGFLGFLPDSAFTLAEPVVFDGGNILAYGTPIIAGQVTLNTTINIQPFETTSILTINGGIDGSGGFNKTGPGRLILSGAADLYDGATSVVSGTLQLDTTVTSVSAVTVRNTATLWGNGSTGGTIDGEPGATVAPGDSPG